MIDLSFVSKAADGAVTVVEAGDADVPAAFGALRADDLDLLSEEDLGLVGMALAPDSAALVAVWENTWANRLVQALREARGTVRMLERVPRPVVQDALAALDGEA